MNINGININISNMMGDAQQTANYAYEMMQTCTQHPSCTGCPYVGQPAQMGNEVQICENGINKKKEST